MPLAPERSVSALPAFGTQPGGDTGQVVATCTAGTRPAIHDTILVRLWRTSRTPRRLPHSARLCALCVLLRPLPHGRGSVRVQRLRGRGGYGHPAAKRVW